MSLLVLEAFIRQVLVFDRDWNFWQPLTFSDDFLCFSTRVVSLSELLSCMIR